MPSHQVFVSYRRDDSAATARNLRNDLVQAFGPDAVFTDVEEIAPGDTWPARLQAALDSAAVLLVVIGPDWLRQSDEYGRRRLDLPGDWVRTEIEQALARPIPIIPVLVGRAKMPPRAGLPPSITGLRDQQHIELRDTHWRTDIEPLLDRLGVVAGLRRVGTRVPVAEWPKGRQPDMLPRALRDEEVRAFLTAHPAWELVASPLPGEYPKTRTELFRRFRFTSFDRVIGFMLAAAPFINERNHHPRWEHVFKTLDVWLSTWDSGHVVSRLDSELARHLDELYEQAVQRGHA